MCLDGSPPGYYFRPGKINNIIIFKVLLQLLRSSLDLSTIVIELAPSIQALVAVPPSGSSTSRGEAGAMMKTHVWKEAKVR